MRGCARDSGCGLWRGDTRRPVQPMRLGHLPVAALGVKRRSTARSQTRRVSGNSACVQCFAPRMQKRPFTGRLCVRIRESDPLRSNMWKDALNSFENRLLPDESERSS